MTADRHAGRPCALLPRPTLAPQPPRAHDPRIGGISRPELGRDVPPTAFGRVLCPCVAAAAVVSPRTVKEPSVDVNPRHPRSPRLTSRGGAFCCSRDPSYQALSGRRAPTRLRDGRPP